MNLQVLVAPASFWFFTMVAYLHLEGHRKFTSNTFQFQIGTIVGLSVPCQVLGQLLPPQPSWLEWLESERSTINGSGSLGCLIIVIEYLKEESGTVQYSLTICKVLYSTDSTTQYSTAHCPPVKCCTVQTVQ